MRYRPLVALNVLVPVLVGCATAPNVEYSYFPARALTAVTVTQTVACNTSKTRLNVTYTPNVVTAYSSDRSAKPLVLDTRGLKSGFADTEIKLEWFDDGRLKSVNQNSTGQGESIVKAAMAFLNRTPDIVQSSKTKLKACDAVVDVGDDKPIAIVYERTLEPATSTSPISMIPNPNSKQTYDALIQSGMKLPQPTLKIEPLQVIAPLVKDLGDSNSRNEKVFLKLNKTAVAPLQILVEGVPYSESKVVVPTKLTYVVPLPKARLFGKEGISLTLNEAGAITSLGYTTASGAVGAFNAGSSLTPPQSTDAAKAAALQAEADVIAQTRRLANCQAEPTECE